MIDLIEGRIEAADVRYGPFAMPAATMWSSAGVEMHFYSRIYT